jgi:uncharacterized membrane protein (UPF0127 family)/phosphopantetheine adenylyltransferase
MANIALYPGGYKPPHIGHYKAAKIATEQTDKVIVFVGPKERNGITQDMSVKLWNLYTQNDPIEIRKAGVSPVRDVYDFVELEAKDGDTLYFIKGEKDSKDPRFVRIPSYAEKFNKKINIEYINVPDQFSRSEKPVSGTLMRTFIKDNDKESFIDGLPLGVDEEAAWNTVTNLKEDLYDPNEPDLAFMRSSEFKAGLPDGSKKDIPRKGDQIHRRQVNPHAHMSEDAQFEKGKVLHVYDFDDTIAQVKTNIKTIITSPNDPDFFQELEISSTEFPEKSKELEARLGHLDITYDFKDFEKQIGDAIINTGVVNKLKKSLSRSDIKTTILTARSIGHPVTRYMREELGLDAYVVPLGLQVDGKVTGQDKSNWIEDHIKKGYQTIYFIDDSEENRIAVNALKDKYPDIFLKVENPADVSELMIGMMTEPKKKKHTKNLKRLNKDLKKQGNQYMKVPNYLKGTLTRKLYEEKFANHSTSAARIDDIIIPLEVMDTPEKQVMGMSGRNEMEKGMIFPYDQVSQKDFHMEGCKIPLDIIFIRGEKITKIHHNCPPCKQTPCPKYSGMADNVLELPGGYCKKNNIKVGDEINLNLAYADNKPLYPLRERKLTKGELKDRERIAKDLPDKEFKKRYGKDWKSVKLATATKLAKKNENYPPYKADQVQKVRYQASDTFTNSPKQAKKRGYLEEIGIDLSNYKGQILPGDVLRAPKGFPLGGKKLEKSLQLKVVKNSREGVNRYKLSLEDKNGKKYTVRNFQMDGEYKGKKLPKWGLVRKSKKNIKEGDTYEKMAAKGKKKGNLKQGTVRKRLKIKAGDKIPLSKITKAISRIKKMKNPSEKNKKFLKALNLAKTLKTTTNLSSKKENIDPKSQAKHKGKAAPYGSAYKLINEKDPKKGTGKKPKGSGRRLYTDEDPSDTVKVKFSTRQDIVDTLSKKSFKAKSHARKSQIINLIHQRVRAALGRTKDPQKKKRLKSAFEYIKKRKEASKRKTKRMRKEAIFTKNWWKEVINEILLTEGGAAGHMAHPFNLPDVNNGKQLLDVFKKAADSLNKNPGSVKIDGVNSSIRLVDLDGEKQFVMDRGSKKPLDVKGITKDDLLDRFGDGHGMVKVGGEVLDMFNEALPSLEADLKKLGAYDDPNILFNMEYVSGKTNVQDYGSNFIAIHGLNKIETKEVQGKRKMLTKRISSEVPYSKDDLQSLLDNLEPTAKKKGFEVYGSVPTNMTKKPNFNAALSKTYTVEAGENTQTKSLGEWLNTLNDIPEEDFIFMNVDYEKNSSTINRKKVGAVSKQVYLAILNGENVDGLFDDEKDKEKAIQGFITYLATEKLGDEVLKVLDSPMGSVENHEGVVIRDENITNVPFKITGKFILGGLISDF